jgi:hypothetical protein
MNTERDTERLLRQWLDEGPTRAADRLLETVEGRIDRQRQRPGWRLNWRDLFMNRTIGSFAAGMAVVAVALVGYNVVAGRGTDDGGLGGPAEPSPAAVATPSAVPSSPPASEAPTAGERGLAWSFSGSLPEGWSQEGRTFGHGEGASVEIFENRSVMSTIPDCIYGPAEGIGTTASEFVGALATREGLDVAGPEPVEVGGLSGDTLGIGMSQEWTATCPWWEAGTPVVPTYGAFDEKNYWLFQAASGDERYRLYVLDVPGGGNVVISVYAPTLEVMETYADDAASIVEGIVFDVGS